MGERRIAYLHPALHYEHTATTLTCAFSHHDGQSKGGGLSLLILVAILPHLLEAALHVG